MKPLYVVHMQTLLREKMKGCQDAITKFCFFNFSVNATQQHVFHSNTREEQIVCLSPILTPLYNMGYSMNIHVIACVSLFVALEVALYVMLICTVYR